jgi:hypothetical protein
VRFAEAAYIQQDAKVGKGLASPNKSLTLPVNYLFIRQSEILHCSLNRLTKTEVILGFLLIE